VLARSDGQGDAIPRVEKEKGGEKGSPGQGWCTDREDFSKRLGPIRRRFRFKTSRASIKGLIKSERKYNQQKQWEEESFSPQLLRSFEKIRRKNTKKWAEGRRKTQERNARPRQEVMSGGSAYVGVRRN